MKEQLENRKNGLGNLSHDRLNLKILLEILEDKMSSTEWMKKRFKNRQQEKRLKKRLESIQKFLQLTNRGQGRENRKTLSEERVE